MKRRYIVLQVTVDVDWNPDVSVLAHNKYLGVHWVSVKDEHKEDIIYFDTEEEARIEAKHRPGAVVQATWR
ncbi:hypothetical protein CPD4_49 [Clostridium phage CPD4]|nr:hypothetical protein CPD4_49 [Clostridium phage CPD4]